ncbi:hypothetical protein [Spiroplasma diminutum]|uniref:Uncharacterized protein n=1 Tax=Spiroplasma diminutum CUAS-1 TaxID=1276221 RepID=S5LVH5_9MOLU|nr:hypothetical protein [Spiroplasma diminutum]AGR41809.1 hypothetical protein SDIMI_v3c01050 [Spiroplasma diminutum CUAS-1]
MKDTNKVMLKKDKQTNFVKEYKNFALLYRINLKLSLKNVGSIISGILFAFVTIILFFVEFTEVIKSASLNNYATYKILTYSLSSSLLIFHILLNSLYLFKKQVSDGISSIELRAGYKTWKSYLIRVFIIFSTSLIYILITLLSVIILNLTSINDTVMIFSLHYSQVFFFGFLAFFSTLVLSTIMIMFKTSLATIFAMLYILMIALAPITASIKFMIINSENSNYKTNIKMIAGESFYQANSKNENLFNDDNGSGESKTITSIDNYIQEVLKPLEGKTDGGKVILPAENYFNGFDLKGVVKENALNDSYSFNYAKANHILTKNLGLGQVYYKYNVFNQNQELEQEFLLEKSPVWNILEPINKTVLEKTNSFTKSNSEKIPTLFVKTNKYYSNRFINSKNIDINTFIDELKQELPELYLFLNFIQKFYNEYKSIILSLNFANNGFAMYNDILDNALLNNSSYMPSKSLNYYSWKETWTEEEGQYNRNFSRNFCEVDKYNSFDNSEWYVCKENTDLIKHNNDMAKVYADIPELTILNQLIVSLWRMSMDFDTFRDNRESIDDSLYNYFNITVASNSLKTDIFRHFAAISTGLFSKPLTNDLYNVSSSGFYQGQFYNIKNIFEFENYSYQNKDLNAPMEPVYKNKQIKNRVVFIIPLAYFAYIVLISPLGYVGYFMFNRKSKL